MKSVGCRVYLLYQRRRVQFFGSINEIYLGIKLYKVYSPYFLQPSTSERLMVCCRPDYYYNYSLSLWVWWGTPSQIFVCGQFCKYSFCLSLLQSLWKCLIHGFTLRLMVYIFSLIPSPTPTVCVANKTITQQVTTKCLMKTTIRNHREQQKCWFNMEERLAKNQSLRYLG